AAAGKVAHGHGHGIRTRSVRHRTLERAVAVAQQYAGLVRKSVGHHDIVPAILVEIPHGDAIGVAAGGGEAHVLEGAIAVSQEHAYQPGKSVGTHQISVAIAPKVAHRDRRSGARIIMHLALESAVAAAQEHNHVLNAADGHVEVAVVPEIRHDHAAW